MAMDVAAFAKQLREDGIDASKGEAEKILAEAKTKADSIRSEAENAAKKRLAQAEEEAVKMKQRSEAELRLVGRDLLLEVKRQVEQVAGVLLKEKAAQALSSDEVVKNAIIELLKTQKTGKEWELALGPTVGKTLAEAAVKDLFKTQDAQVKLTAGLKTAGFELKASSGSQVVEVTEQSVSEAFKRLLSAELGKLLDQSLSAKK